MFLQTRENGDNSSSIVSISLKLEKDNENEKEKDKKKAKKKNKDKDELEDEKKVKESIELFSYLKENDSVRIESADNAESEFLVLDVVSLFSNDGKIDIQEAYLPNGKEIGTLKIDKNVSQNGFLFRREPKQLKASYTELIVQVNKFSFKSIIFIFIFIILNMISA